MEEFEELFYQDPYRKECFSRVVSCEKMQDHYDVVLDDTVFYPEGGGQPGDRGKLNEVPVIDTVRRDGVIHHICEKPVEVNAEVKACIDWNRRFRHMQSHSGEHIVSGLIHQLYGYDNVGFHMGEVIQIDFNGQLQEEDCRKIERMANEIIWKDEEIRTWIPDEAELAHLSYRSKKELSGKVRIVTIPEADQCACCGTHVKRTGEIGIIRILSAVKHKNGVRLQMLAGEDCYDHIRKVSDENREVSHLLSVPVTETGEAVRKSLEEAAANKEKAEHWMERYAAMVFAGQGDPAYLFGEDMDRLSMRRAAKNAMETGKHTVLLFNQEENGTVSYLFMSDRLPLRTIVRELNQALNGRGGGRDDMVQGSFSCDMDTVRKTVKEKLG